MPTVVLNSNVAAMQAERRLNQGTRELSQVFERLASGLRINRASDDAAGLSISESLKADRRVYNQGVRNLNDGAGLLAVADSALENLGSIVIRLKELAEQAANGVYGPAQRKALDEEAQKLALEFSRIAATTQFNQTNLFNGSFGSLRLQAGYGADGGILSSLAGAIGNATFATGMNSSGVVLARSGMADFNNDGNLDVLAVKSSGIDVLLGNGDGSFSVVTATTLSPAESTPGDFNGDGIIDFVKRTVSNAFVLHIGNGDGTFRAGVTTATTVVPGTLVTGDFDNNGTLDLYANQSGTFYGEVFLNNGSGTFVSRQTVFAASYGGSSTVADVNRDGYLDLVQGGPNGGGISYNRGNGTFAASIDPDFASFESILGFTSMNAADVNGDGRLDAVGTMSASNRVAVYLQTSSGAFTSPTFYNVGTTPQNTTIADMNGDGFAEIAVAQQDGTVGVLRNRGDGTFAAMTTHATGVSLGVLAGDVNNDGVLDLLTANIGTGINVQLGNSVSGVNPILSFSLKSVADARQALPMLGKKLELIGIQRGAIGAIQSRVTTAVNTLEITSENSQSAISRITDVDVATASADLTRLRILQQSATAILGQANSQPELALRLLGGL